MFSTVTGLVRLAARRGAAVHASHAAARGRCAAPMTRHFASTTSDDGPKSAVLLYSGGLDTSCILRWLLDEGFEVHAFLADLGQEEDFDAVRAKATKIGATSVHIAELREDFLLNYINPAIKCNALYENLYLLGTSLARPCISAAAVEYAHRMGCGYLAHGATGKGNDQVRFELSFAALDPSLKTIVPWRNPEFFNRFKGRTDLLEYAEATGIPVVQTAAKPYSMDENMLHISYEAGVLEDPSQAHPDGMFRLTTDPIDAPDTPANVRVHFEKGVATRVENSADGADVSGSLNVFEYLNTLAGAHGVGRVDVVENRFVGIKSRGVYECPAGTVLRLAHVGLEGLCLDREVYRLRDMLASKFTDYCYNGFWFSPEMEFVLHAVEKSQEHVTGFVDVELFKGSANIKARTSPFSLYSAGIASMDDIGEYDPTAAAGFIDICAHRLRAHTKREAGTSS